MPIKVPVTQTGLEASIEAAAKSAGRKLKINLGTSAKSIEGLSQPLGRITGKADQFTKSMEAANARVLAFGASVGVLSAVTRGFQQLVTTTIDVEKRLTAINSILGGTASQLDSFKKTIFDVAKNTEQSFGTVADAALELSRQGLKAEEVTKRLNDALILSRLSGLGASEAVAGLTAAINSFNREGVTSAEVLNKLSAAAVSAAVSERDLIEGIKRSGSVAIQAGVSLDELVGVITAVQSKTARGGSVIGNSFKTIFTRIQSLEKLQTMQNLGVQITDFNGDVLSGTKLIENLAKALSSVPDARRLQIAENLVGKFQVAPFLAILDDYNSKTSKAIEVTKISQNATTEAYERNKVLNQTLSAAINSTVVSVQKLAETLGKIGVTDNLKGILSFFNSLVTGLQNILDGDGLGSKFAKGIVKGIGNVISGPGLAIFGAIIAKLTIDLAKFGVGSLNTFFGLNKAAKEQATLQGQIASTLLGNSDIQKRILTIENSTLSVEQKRAAQTKFFTTALNEQLAVMTRMQAIAAKVTPGVFAGTRGGKGRAAGGFIPNYNAVMGYGSERADISRGVGGAPSSAKPVSIPNFNFGGGQKGTMVANTSEYMVPNFAGTGGSAIFNQEMVASMGLPSGAKKIGAAGGYIPNFAAVPTAFSELVRRRVPGAFKTGNFSSLAAQKELRLPFSSDAQMGKLYANSSLRRDFDKLSPTQKRNLKQQGRQRAVTAKGTDQLAKFGILYPDAIGQQKPVTLTIDKTPVRAIPVATDPPNKLYKEIRKSLVKSAKKYANSLGFVPDIIKDAKFGKAIDRNLNEGSIEAAYGSVFEAAFQGAMGTEQKSTTRWDLANPAAIETLMGMIKSNGMLQGIRPQLAGITSADFKNSLSPDNLASIKGKIKASTGKKKRAAGGYIPSFAAPLQEAVARETAAGLPINQVRVNQDPSLRNSANPMGLAITNTRDEPTGAIPNFAKGGKATAGEAQDVMGGFVGKMLAVQIGMSALSGILGEVTEKNKLVSGSLTALNVAVSAALVAQSFGGFGKVARGIGSFATGGLGRNVIGKGQGIVQRGVDASRTSNLIAGGSNAGMMARKGVGLQVTGALTKVGGALLSFAGPVGIAAVAAFGVSKAMDYISGRTEKAADMQEDLADSAASASRKLDSLRIPQELREDNRKRAKERSERELEQLGMGMDAERGSIFSMQGLKDVALSLGPTGFIGMKRLFDRTGGNIKGGEDEGFEAAFAESIKQAMEAGVSGSVISRERAILEATREKGEQFDSADIEDFVDRLAGLRSNLDIQKSANRTASKLDDAQIQNIIDVNKKTKEAEDRGVDLSADVQKQKRQQRADILAASKGVEGADIADQELLIAAAIEKVLQSGSKLEKLSQVRADIAKAQAISELKILEIKSTFIDDLDIELQKGQILNTLSKSEISALQTKIKLRDEDRSANNAISELLQEEIGKVEKLTVAEADREAIKETIRGISAEDLKDEKTREKVLDKIRTLAGEEVDIAKVLNDLFGSGVQIILDQSNARKEGIELTGVQTCALPI